MRFVLLLLVVLFAEPPAVRAQGVPDRVIVRSDSGNGQKSYYGTIQDYGADFLSIRLLKRGTLQQIPVARIQKVETPLVQNHIDGLQLFEESEATAAREKFATALNDETRDWVKQDLRAMLVRCDCRLGDFVGACDRFIALVGDNSRVRHFDYVPLAWQPPQEPFDKTKPVRWLKLKSKTARLLGASLLLRDKQHGQAAIETLRDLTSCGEILIQQLADVQLWRVRLLSEKSVRNGELIAWNSRIRTLPDRQRPGAWYLLGLAHEGRQELDEAAIALLRPPLAYAHLQPRLAAQSGLRAASVLRKAGHKQEAQTLLLEISQKYRDTELADNAERMLNR